MARRQHETACDRRKSIGSEEYPLIEGQKNKAVIGKRKNVKGEGYKRCGKITIHIRKGKNREREKKREKKKAEKKRKERKEGEEREKEERR